MRGAALRQRKSPHAQIAERPLAALSQGGRIAHRITNLRSWIRHALNFAAKVILDASWRPNSHARVLNACSPYGPDRTNDIMVPEIARSTNHCHPPLGRF